jgi:flagellar hook-associated protein 3 FlgL
MPWPPTLGSQALPAQLQRAGLALRAEVQRHSVELTTGRVADPARHLRGDLGPLAAIETRLQRIGAHDGALRAAALTARTAQDALGQLADLGNSIRDRLLTVTSGEATPEALTRTGQGARAGLSAMISALSAQVAGRAVFSGTATDRGPLPDAATLMAAVGAHLAGATTAQDISLGLDDFFDSPGGAFDTLIYAGGPPISAGASDPDAGVIALPTAADPAIRGLLRGAVMAALLAEPAVVPDVAHRRDLARIAAERHGPDAERLVGLRAGLGTTEAALDDTRTRLSVERDTLVNARSGLIGVDPFAAASRLEETRARLEALYAVTARVARLSLTEYLR